MEAAWICGPEFDYGENAVGYYADHRDHVLSARFELASVPAAAELSIAVLGFADVRINGQRLGVELLGAWTNPTKTIYHDVLDVTSLLVAGENRIEVELGNGWYNPSPLTLFGKYNLRQRLVEVGTPAFQAELVADGEQVLATGEDWSCELGNRVFNNIYLGERVDFTLASEASEARAVPAPAGEPLACPVPPCRRFEAYEPVSATPLGEGTLYDFGIMVTGTVELELAAAAGTAVRVSYAEALDEKGDPCYDTNYAGLVGLRVPTGDIVPGGEGGPSTGLEQDVIVCGEGTSSFTGLFSTHSFRYAYLEGAPAEAVVSFRAHSVHTDLAAAGQMRFDHPFYQQLYDAALLTKLNNVHGLWEDCARERLGYGGDMVALSHSNFMAFNCGDLIVRTLRAFRDDQTAAGGVPETAPYMGIQSNGTGQGEGPILWQLAYPYLAVRAIRYYGLRDEVSVEWPYIKKLMDYLLGWDPEELASHCLGDHGSVQTVGAFGSGTPDKEFVGWCSILWMAQLGAELERLMGDDQGYAEKVAQLKPQIVERFAREDGSFGDGTQTSYAFAGALGLADAKRMADALAARIAEQDGLMLTGIFGTMHAYELLHAHGHDREVEAWLLRRGEPSFSHMLANGSGAIAEEFYTKLSSLNHAMFTSYLQWMYQALGGIAVAADAVAADHVIVDPYFSPQLDGCSCAYDGASGRVEVSWRRRTDASIALNVRTEGNVRAEISGRVAALPNVTITKNGTQLQ
ncbi:family 78 glycoside hydrolase catalytic domain [Paratractidigestivibacter sp.]|uniref:family 78 glycoside hydrolase catalytic domain n=1 Tax=Paratractidigestivibacter sp. TaxID=2847316 RepID=UPI002AC90E1D|nr:family 78 glycoside hydrolase catalytic domain [Paratractidigestivibacter sp.]